MAGGANNNNSQTAATTTMASQNQNNGNGSGNRFTKTKSGSLPGRYTNTSASGNANVLLSPSPYSPPGRQNTPSSPIPPGAYYHNYSARPYSFMPATATVASPTVTNPQQQQRPPPITSVVAPGSRPKEKEHSSKKWNPFGGLFRRKDKQQQQKSAAPVSVTSVAAVPIKIQFEASQRPPSASAAAVISSGASDDELESMSDTGENSINGSSSDSEAAGRKKRSSFLARKLSGGSGKKKKQPTKVVHADLLRVPAPAAVLRQHPNGRLVSQQRNQNRYSQPILQSWETTKKIAVVPPTSSSSLLMLNQPSNNYSDSGSLSLSLEGSSSLTKGSKAATKARAEARRNSYIHEDSSSEDDAMRGAGGSGSFQGSHSSLSLRNKKNGYKNGNGGSVAPARPPAPSLDNLGLPLPQWQWQHQQQSSTSSPTLQQQQYQHQQHQQMQPMPTSPRWEARVVYTKETLQDDDKPVIVKLPKYSKGAPSPLRNYQTQETLSSDVNDDGQIVVTAGLRVPIAMHADRVSVNVKEPIYANMRSASPSPSPAPASLALPPKGGFYRPVSCSFLDSYRRQKQDSQPQSVLQYEKEPVRLRSPVDVEGYEHTYERVPLSAASVAAKLLPTPSSPVHTRAANFWKQKEQETLQQQQSGGSGSANGSISPSPVRERPPVATSHGRIRSADTSPLLYPKHQPNKAPTAIESSTATATAGNGHGVHRSLNSTESISSLSSFTTTNETHSPSPNSMFKHSQRPPSRNAIRGKIPAGFQQRSSYRSNRALSSSSATGILSPTARSTPLDDARNNNNIGGSRSSSIKSPGRNLEDALNELEDMYKSLQLSDEDLLDRAERRDLPTPHQELRNKDLGYFNFDEPSQQAYLNGNGNETSAHANDGRIQSPIYFYSPSPTGYGAIGSLESLTSGTGTGTSGSGELGPWGRRPGSRVRAPPLRRAGVPDPVKDDMAKRKYDASTKEPKPADPREQISQTGSYLVLSPAFSPPVSPIPSSIDNYGGPGQQFQNYDPSQSNLLLSRPDDPDLTQDDVTVRNYKRANAIRIIPEPQPKFGIPLGPITKAPNSDYLHATPMERHRPLYRHVKNPDLVKDDIAFRALRKDLNQETNNLSSCQWTPKLFSPLRNFENVFNYNEKLINGNDNGEEDEKAKSKRLRAVRSLSANISSLQSNLLQGRSPSPRATTPVNCFYSLAGSGGSKELGNNSDYKFFKAPPNANANPNAAGNYMEPSWVQQIELDQDELRELKRSLSPTRVRPLIRSRDVNPVTVMRHMRSQQASRPMGRSSSSPAASDGSPKPRRPWTDLIFESLEQEKAEREQLQQRQQNGAMKCEHEYDYDYDDDEEVFMDASCQTPRDSPVKHEHAEPQRPTSFLNGQKSHRGNGAEPNENGAGAQVTHLFTGYGKKSVDSNGNAHDEFLMKRKSWSDFPQPQSSSSAAAGSGLYPTTTSSTAAAAKLDFNPIPPLRRVKQINLEGFHSSESKDNADAEAAEAEQEMVQLQHQPQPVSILKQPTVKSSPTKGEQELDNLIHALVKEADTCGDSRVAPDSASALEPELEPKRKRKIEIKARYPIDDDVDFSTSYTKTKPSTSSTSSIEPQSQPSTHTYTIEPGSPDHHDPLKRLIKTINENLVPTLETSIRESQTRMSQMNLAAVGDQEKSSHDEKPAAESSKASKPKPLPRHKIVTDDELLQSKQFDDSTLNSDSTNTDKQSQSKETNKISSFGSIVTHSSLCLGKWPQSQPGLKQVPSIQVTGVASGTDSAATASERSFLRPNKDLSTISPGDGNVDVRSKRDSLSHAEGMTLLKKLLSRENSTQHTQTQSQSAAENSNYFLIHGGIKKSPSTGTTNMSNSFKSASNWSTSANPNLNLATPPFLRKYFKDLPVQQPKESVQVLVQSVPMPAATPEPANMTQIQPKPQDVLALNVAQKANLFMKMEHEQRFSKWRKKAEALEAPVPVPVSTQTLAAPRQSTGSRFVTQPVTNQEFSNACALSISERTKPEAQVQQPRSIESSSAHGEGGNVQTLSKSKGDNSTTENERRKTSISSLTSSGSGTTASAEAKKPAVRIEPSCLSIKDRVSLFNRMSTGPAATINLVPMPNANTGVTRFSKSPTCIQSAPESSPQVVHRRDGTDNEAAGANALQLRGQPVINKSFNHQEPVSIRDRSRENHSSRHTKGKSLTVAHSWEPDYASEDGEVSSGGQEVSDIISKSYDNSPMFRKKTWKSQIPQVNLSKEIWRKFEQHKEDRDNQEYKPTTTQVEPNSSCHMSMRITAAVNSGCANQERVAPSTTITSSSSSNLLPILRVLSSSDDGFEPDAEDYAAKLKIDATSNSVKDPSKKSVRKYLKMRTTTATAESFQSPKQQPEKPQEPIYDNVSATCVSMNTNHGQAPVPEAAGAVELQLSAVQREGDLLVMKKHMPTVKRKSSHKASRNPLKALAARLEFRN